MFLHFCEMLFLELTISDCPEFQINLVHVTVLARKRLSCKAGHASCLVS